MSKYTVTGKLDTIVAVRYTGSDLGGGKWSVQPGGQSPIGTGQLFIAENRQNASYGPDGWVSYTAADGTIFSFTFNDPTSNANNCSSSMGNVHGNYVLPTPTYPSAGKTWDVTYSIVQPSTFFDAPVFPDDLLKTLRCDAYPQVRLLPWLKNLTCVRLKDVLEKDEVPIDGKLWCITHPLFLTPKSRSVLLEKLFSMVSLEFKNIDMITQKLHDDILQFNKDVYLEPDKLNSYVIPTELDNELLKSKEKFNKSDADIIIHDILAALISPDRDTNWKNAVYSYCGGLDDNIDLYNKRMEKIISLVEKEC